MTNKKLRKLGPKMATLPKKKLKKMEKLEFFKGTEVLKFVLDNNIQILNIRWNPCKSKG